MYRIGWIAVLQQVSIDTSDSLRVSKRGDKYLFQAFKRTGVYFRNSRSIRGYGLKKVDTESRTAAHTWVLGKMTRTQSTENVYWPFWHTNEQLSHGPISLSNVWRVQRCSCYSYTLINILLSSLTTFFNPQTFNLFLPFLHFTIKNIFFNLFLLTRK